MLKTIATVLGLTLVLAACEPVPTAQAPNGQAGKGSAAATQMNQVFTRYTPLSFKAMRIAEMRQRLKAGGYRRISSNRTGAGETQELWYGAIERSGKPAAQTRVRLTTCKNSTIVRHSRSTLDNMTAGLAREVLGFIRARSSILLKDERQTQGGQRMRFVLLGADGPDGRLDVPRGKLENALGGLRIFDNGNRRLGITIHTSCG